MLEYLHIRNLALIEDAALEFTDGMNVLTGETGAGKSFILKALTFLLGERLKADMVRAGAERAIVEASFETEEGDLILRREIMAESGRSRIFVNDTLHSQEILKELRPKLITYTSQHAQQQLLQPSFQSKLIEKHFPKPELLLRREELLSQLRSLNQKMEDLLARQKSLLESRDLLEMQQAEIEKVHPEEGEEERLEGLREQARNGEVLRKTVDEAQRLLLGRDPQGLFENLSSLEKLLGIMSEVDGSFEGYLNATLDYRAQLDTLLRALQNTSFEDDAPDLNEIEERLYALAQLKRKLHRTIPQILALQNEIAENLSFLDSVTLDLHHLQNEEATLMAELKDVLWQIKPLRHAAAETFTSRLEEQLRDLAFSERVRVVADFSAQPLWKELCDERIRLLWAPNPGQQPRPLDQIASGGELSRFLLALTSLEERDDTSTYIFDEVDAGVGGLTLGKLAEKLAHLAKHHQIILITHWPQLASRAKRHFQIQKIVDVDTTSTVCHMLTAQERQEELIRMAGGGDVGKAFLESLAKESATKKDTEEASRQK